MVRHADAGHRRPGGGPLDKHRELSDRGRRQAEGLAASLGDDGITRLISSPYRRCVQTLEPLGQRLGVAVEHDERLAEGNGAEPMLCVAREVRTTTAVLCSHGDVIPDLLEALLAGGTRLVDELRWQKASTWVLTWDGDRLTKGRYHPPPA